MFIIILQRRRKNLLYTIQIKDLQVHKLMNKCQSLSNLRVLFCCLHNQCFFFLPFSFLWPFFSFLSIPNFIERYGCILLLFSCLFMFLHELTSEDSVLKFTYYILWPFWIYVYLKFFLMYMLCSYFLMVVLLSWIWWY